MCAIMTENPANWLDKHGDYLFAFAFRRLRDRTVAEDLVQETMLVALQSRDNFSNNSSEKTWLTAILKNKIFDHFCRTSRQVMFASDEEEVAFFDNEGCWLESPKDWNASPESLYQERKFYQILQACLMELPNNLATVFSLREIDGLDTSEICDILNISPNNLWVMLHRARLQLRQSVEARWFGIQQKPLTKKRELAA